MSRATTKDCQETNGALTLGPTTEVEGDRWVAIEVGWISLTNEVHRGVGVPTGRRREGVRFAEQNGRRRGVVGDWFGPSFGQHQRADGVADLVREAHFEAIKAYAIDALLTGFLNDSDTHQPLNGTLVPHVSTIDASNKPSELMTPGGELIPVFEFICLASSR
jgi:hypothetical protein